MVIRHQLDLIVSDETIRKGKPCIEGTGVRVMDVALAKIAHGQDADGIAEWYDLSLPQVYAALAYYYEHKETMDAELRQEMKQARELKAEWLGKQNSLLSR